MRNPADLQSAGTSFSYVSFTYGSNRAISQAWNRRSKASVLSSSGSLSKSGCQDGTHKRLSSKDCPILTPAGMPATPIRGVSSLRLGHFVTSEFTTFMHNATLLLRLREAVQFNEDSKV